jgi:hypothetical protein
MSAVAAGRHAAALGDGEDAVALALKDWRRASRSDDSSSHTRMSRAGDGIAD